MNQQESQKVWVLLQENKSARNTLQFRGAFNYNGLLFYYLFQKFII
jgi:hypothetical protein